MILSIITIQLLKARFIKFNKIHKNFQINKTVTYSDYPDQTQNLHNL